MGGHESFFPDPDLQNLEGSTTLNSRGGTLNFREKTQRSFFGFATQEHSEQTCIFLGELCTC